MAIDEAMWTKGSEVATKHDLRMLKHEIELRFIQMERERAERSLKRTERGVWIFLGALFFVSWTFLVYLVSTT